MSINDQKLCTELWLSPLSLICLWLDGINAGFKKHLDNKSKKMLYSQWVPSLNVGE